MGRLRSVGILTLVVACGSGTHEADDDDGTGDAGAGGGDSAAGASGNHAGGGRAGSQGQTSGSSGTQAGAAAGATNGGTTGSGAGGVGGNTSGGGGSGGDEQPLAGQAGEGGQAPSVPELPPAKATAVSIGTGYGCALVDSGRVRCWGNNFYGQLGDGTTTNSLVPVEVDGLDDAVSIAAGFNHTCAVRATGSIVCWGSNNSGELGINSTSRSPRPVSVQGIDSAISVTTAWGFFTCAALADGTARCFGTDGYGELGDGGNLEEHIPSPVQNLTKVLDVKGGTKFACALLADGTVACWGVDDDGQLGTGEAIQNFWARVPVPVVDVTDAVAIACGSATACAVIADGSVKCWGAYSGLFSEDTLTDPGEPRPLPGIEHAVAVDVGVASACVLEEDGVVSCFGYGDRGALGNGSIDSKYHAAGAVPTLGPATGIDAALSAACTVLEGGGVRCWGAGSGGLLGNGAETDSATPVEVVGFSGG